MKETLEQRLSHAKYEYEMACHCIDQLQRPQTQAQWNALLAAFAVYFRNLEKNFLKGDGDQETIKAKNYVKRFAAASADDLKDELNELHWQILHLSGQRTNEDQRKLGLAKALKLMRWLRENIAQFEKELDEPHKSQWNKKGPEGPKTKEIKLRGWTGRAPPSATNQITDTASAPMDEAKKG